MIKAIIFDLDGVIVSTDHYHYQAWKRIADKLNIPFDEEANNHLRGVSRMESLDIILSGSDIRFSEEEKVVLAKEKNDDYRKLLEQLTPADLSKEVEESLLALRERGLKLAIGSSSKNAWTILSRIGLGDFFDAVSDGTRITNSKPDPEVFLKASEYLLCEPEECLVVEDAVAGIIAGHRAGMKTIAIGDAKSYYETDYKVNEFSDIIGIVEGMK